MRITVTSGGAIGLVEPDVFTAFSLSGQQPSAEGRAVLEAEGVQLIDRLPQPSVREAGEGGEPADDFTRLDRPEECQADENASPDPLALQDRLHGPVEVIDRHRGQKWALLRCSLAADSGSRGGAAAGEDEITAIHVCALR